MTVKIVVNGQEYTDPNAMPADVRTIYDRALRAARADADGNGIPDILERPAGNADSVVVQTRIVYEGKEYASADDLPPSIRAAYERAVSPLGGKRVRGADVRSAEETAAGPSVRAIEPESALDLRTVATLLGLLALAAAVVWIVFVG